MPHKKSKRKSFKQLLQKYLAIKGLDIILVLEDGREIELSKNRSIINDMIVTYDVNNAEKKIPISRIKHVDLYAA
ncbi:MAG: hypothetical protein A2W19_13420 [Spirochaetes bacterium RBG_16_49_21]|nr:MAG: hypothetical protein A2W19_13420 [Spirochaetes bacterium RBG_16_49_21]